MDLEGKKLQVDDTLIDNIIVTYQYLMGRWMFHYLYSFE